MINGALEVGFLLLQRQISLSAIRALLSIMVTYYYYDIFIAVILVALYFACYRQWNDFRTDITQDNMIVCDCSSLWLQQYLRFNRPYYEYVLCGYPIEFRGQRLRSVDIANCSKHLIKIQ